MLSIPNMNENTCGACPEQQVRTFEPGPLNILRPHSCPQLEYKKAPDLSGAFLI
ncbi:hypothetical protein LAB1_02450 [Roseibium sp. LAB1]